jgi:hypothetical protein
MDTERKEHLPLPGLSTGYLSNNFCGSTLRRVQAAVVRIENDWVSTGAVRCFGGDEVDTGHCVSNPVHSESELADCVVVVPRVDVPPVRRDSRRASYSEVRGKHYLSGSHKAVELRGSVSRTAIRHGQRLHNGKPYVAECDV